jgi:putative ABC transport system permease protein
MNKIQMLQLSFKHWLNDLRSNEKRLLILATLLAAVSMAMISSFSDRLSRTMHYRASELIAADLTIFSTRPIPQIYVDKAQALGIDHSQALGFSTMAFANDQLQLVRVRSVEENYPLKGYNQVTNEFYGKGELLADAPKSGAVWAEERILQKLGVNIGDKIEIGDAILTIERILQQDADRSGSLFSPFGRLLMAKEDVPKTGVVSQGSRIWYKHYYTGSEQALSEFIDWLRPQLDKAEKLGGIEDSQNNVGNALQKAQQYLSLASLISVLLAAVAIALCAQRYSERHFNTAALLRCLGASSNQVRSIFINKLFFTAVIGAVLGALIGFGLHFLLLAIVEDILPKDIMPARFLPVGMSMLSAAMVLMLIALAPILNLNKVSPVRVLRRELAPQSIKANVFFVLAVGIMVMLAYLLTGSIKLSMVFVVGLAFLLLIYGLLSSGLLKLLSSIQSKLPNLLQVGLTQLNRHQYYARSQVAAFAFIFTSVALIWIVRGDLFDNWQQQVPEGTPNHFAINILPDKKDDFAQAMVDKGIQVEDFYPMVRGRLTHINGVNVSELFPEDDMPNAINRELNLSWTNKLRDDQQLLQGEWFDELEKDASEVNWISIEAELARRLNVSINDEIQFNIAGSVLNAKIGNLRKVEWENFQPNFYVLFNDGAINNFHHTYINSFYLPPTEGKWLLKLNQKFKAVTVIEIEQILNQVREILGQTSIAVEAILALVLLCAMVLMFATLLSTLGLRKHEAALYRTFGASESMIRFRIRSEYVTLSLLASVLALVSFEGISFALYLFIFNVGWQPHLDLWIGIPVLALASILVSGFYANRDVLKASPRQLLQDIS